MFDRDKILSNQMLLADKVTLKSKQMVVNLIIFDMFDFDMILGIDFLSQYEDDIDYKQKKVWFHLDDSDEFTFDEGCVWSMIISNIKARKKLSEGYIGYLAHDIGKTNDSITSL